MRHRRGLRRSPPTSRSRGRRSIRATARSRNPCYRSDIPPDRYPKITGGDHPSPEHKQERIDDEAYHPGLLLRKSRRNGVPCSSQACADSQLSRPWDFNVRSPLVRRVFVSGKKTAPHLHTCDMRSTCRLRNDRKNRCALSPLGLP